MKIKLKIKDMGKVESSLVKLSGSLNDITFYTREGKEYYRKKSNLNKDRFEKDPAFARTRERSSEFGNSSRFAKILFDVASPYTKGRRDSRAYNRLMSVMNKIKDFDTLSESGQRNPMQGISNPEAQSLLLDYRFDTRVGLHSFLYRNFELDEQGRLSLLAFNPMKELLSIEGAVGFSMLSYNIEVEPAEGACHVERSNEYQGIIEDSFSDVILTFNKPAAAAKTQIYMLMLTFHERQRGNSIPMSGKQGSICAFIAVVAGEN